MGAFAESEIYASEEYTMNMLKMQINGSALNIVKRINFQNSDDDFTEVGMYAKDADTLFVCGHNGSDRSYLFDIDRQTFTIRKYAVLPNRCRMRLDDNGSGAIYDNDGNFIHINEYFGFCTSTGVVLGSNIESYLVSGGSKLHGVTSSGSQFYWYTVDLARVRSCMDIEAGHGVASEVNGTSVIVNVL